MKAFADLYTRLDETTSTGEKIEAIRAYLAAADPADAAWAVYFLSGNRPKRLIPSRRLAAWAIELAGIPDWLFDESYEAVGDLAETIALLLPPAEASSTLPLHHWVEERLLELRNADESEQRDAMRACWAELDTAQRLVWNKLITGEFRVGVSQRLVVRALALVSGVDASILAHRMMGPWEPTAEAYAALVAPDTADAEVSRPFPFFLAHPLESDPPTLGDIRDWQVEWKWDGIRAQLVRRAGRVFLWSRGEELVTDRYPELAQAASALPDGTVLDGEILPFADGRPMSFAKLQLRIGRKSVSHRLLTEVPVVLMTYDLLEHGTVDVRSLPLEERRSRLEQRIAATAANGRFVLSPKIEVESWSALEALRGESRQHGAEGVMIKRKASPYRVGRPRGDWWKWKVNPFTVDAVLIYAQRGSGRRASLYTDYTFGVWDRGQLVPFAKAYSGLTDEEILQVDTFVRRNAVDRFGPVRHVKPELVFELAFEDIRRSTRHRCGVAVRFPRIARWRTDKTIEEADTLDTLRAMLAPEPPRPSDPQLVFDDLLPSD